MFKKNKTILFGFFIIIFCVVPSQKSTAHEDVRQVETAISTRWKSKYVTEGRNNLNDGGIFAVEGNGAFRDLALGVWYAGGDRENYQEINFSAEYGDTFGDIVEVYLSYTRLEFLKTGEHDNELGGELKYEGAVFEPGIKYYYSTESEGGFLEIYLHAKIALLDGRLILKPYVLEGFDFGYATQAHDGPNHSQFGIETSLQLNSSTWLMSTVGHSLAGEDMRREKLGDVSWVSIGFLSEF